MEEISFITGLITGLLLNQIGLTSLFLGVLIGICYATSMSSTNTSSMSPSSTPLTYNTSQLEFHLETLRNFITKNLNR